MVYRPKIDAKLCFVLMPFKGLFDGYYEHIIKKAVKAAGLDALRADEIYGTRSIIRDVWDHIWRARVIVADVTGRNPNVNYELGLCHALGISTILITQDISDVPFDYRHRRCIPYDTKEATWAAKLTTDLTNTLRAVVENPINDEELGWPYDTSLVKQLAGKNATITIESPQYIILRGMAEAERLVSRALGPRGTTVSVASSFGQPASRKEGLDIVMGLHSPNSIEENGIEQMRKVGKVMVEQLGDGTKTAMLLTHALVDGGKSALTEEHPLHELLRGMEKAILAARSFVISNSQTCSTDDLYSVALTSSSGDVEISKLVVAAFEAAGKDGIIVMEAALGSSSELSIQEGLRFDRGYLRPEFITNAGAETCELPDCRVLVHELKITNMRDLLPLLELAARASAPLLVIAEDVDGEALATLVVNNVRGNLKCAAVRSPGTGDRRREVLQDIAVLTGAKLLAADFGPRLDAVRLEDLGTATKVVITRDTTTIFGGKGSEQAVRAQIALLRSSISEANDPFVRARLQERLANLAGQIATVKVRGVTDVDIEDLKYRTLSAINSVRAAIEEGYSFGGGVSFLNAKEAIAALNFQSLSEQRGGTIVSNALDRPFLALVESCRKSPVTLLSERQRASNREIGLNVHSGVLEDIRTAGILDPTKTLQAALDTSFSYAQAILKTDAWSVSPVGPADDGDVGERHFTL